MTMKTIELLTNLENAGMNREVATEITKAIDDIKQEQTTKEFVYATVNNAKYELVKWIVAGIIANGLLATILKYIA